MSAKKIEVNVDSSWSKAITASNQLFAATELDNRALASAINQYAVVELTVLRALIDGFNDALQRLDRIETRLSAQRP